VFVPSSWFCKSLTGSLSFNFKEKFWPCSFFLDHEYEDFLILMRVIVCLSQLLGCHGRLSNRTPGRAFVDAAVSSA
jgi:hypothetical protein